HILNIHPSPTRRSSDLAKVKVGAKKDGTLVGWTSESWGTGGPDAQGGAPSIPYVVRIPDRRVRHTTVLTNIGPARAWREPGRCRSEEHTSELQSRGHLV